MAIRPFWAAMESPNQATAMHSHLVPDDRQGAAKVPPLKLQKLGYLRGAGV